MDRPVMTPAPGSRIVQYVGDRLRFTLSLDPQERMRSRGDRPPGAGDGFRALLRTNLTRGARAREETVALSGSASADPRTFAGASWRDIPLVPAGGGWELDLPLTEVGCFRAKAYLLDPRGRQHWPEGEDVGISVHPDHLRTGNTIYCAFPRMFGPGRAERSTRRPDLEEQLDSLDQRGYTVIPPSGKLRELTTFVPHILGTLGCRILHLLPLGPTPTTFARLGRFGSPYAQLDLAGIDPALVAFDQRTTGVEQFQELAHAVHLRGGRIFLDIVVNHTGWGSRLMEERPGWFLRNPDATFHSPGAWGVVWGDLVELDHRRPELWESVAASLLTWCRRGVDGFRCDAGYMVPLPAWQYIVARVRREFQDCTFLLEGLGGPWEATEALLTEGGMQWAYSELFQNYGPREVSSYLDHAIRQARRMGPLVHYSETHDNLRLAAKAPAWSLLRNRLCALASQCGAFGFTSGVEWLATEKVDVHQARGLAWDGADNLVEELGRLNRLLADHPCFFDGARLARLSADDSPVLALERISWDGRDRCLVLVNLAPEERDWSLDGPAWTALGEPVLDLLGQPGPRARTGADGARVFTLEPWAAHCLCAAAAPAGLAGDAYRARRAQAAWAYQALATGLPAEDLGPASWGDLGALAASDPAAFLGSLSALDPAAARRDLVTALAAARPGYPRVVHWGLRDLGRVVPLPPGHWLLIRDEAPFSASVSMPGQAARHLRSIPVEEGFAAALPPSALAGPRPAEATIALERFKEAGTPPPGRIRLLAETPEFTSRARPGAGLAPDGEAPALSVQERLHPLGNGQNPLCLLTNGRGGMARLHADLGAVTSKYDCLLGANLHPKVPCDRHVLAKRMRAWVNADGFLSALGRDTLVHFEPGPPGRWIFVVPAGDGRTVQVELTLDLLPLRNTVVARFLRRAGPPPYGADLPEDREVTLTVRLDLEDRSFHGETRADDGTERHFRTHTRDLDGRPGFLFQPAGDRRLLAWADAGIWHPQPEWSVGLAHPVEASRGMAAQGDAWSPGWFELPLARGGTATLAVCADPDEPPARDLHPASHPQDEARPKTDSFGRQLRRAAAAFLARRGAGATVIAGYPWFLDWGRDTFIACRGLLAGGLDAPVREILATFARLEDRGTLPNALHGDSTSDRDTSDAPLWFALAAEEAAAGDPGLYQEDAGGRTLGQVLESIARNYLEGTPNGIRVDPGSGLVWSPAHFTWMDTNYPASTPREGYPVEIQALWLRLLRQLERLQARGQDWAALAGRAEASLDLYWDERLDSFQDLLAGPRDCPAREARPDGLLRPNQLFLVSLGLVSGERARRAVNAARRHLLVPGALRSLAPLPARHPLPLHGPGGVLLNDPMHPYWGRYEGDEDTRRKPAYHNGTAWVWLLPAFCEALARAWDFQPEAVAAARAYLGSLDGLLASGCVGHLPEILDGDAPHLQRGCDAQAWSVTEALRVWLLLNR
jgi:predicted glycogen debranching enzyme